MSKIEGIENSTIEASIFQIEVASLALARSASLFNYQTSFRGPINSRFRADVYFSTSERLPNFDHVLNCDREKVTN